MVGCSTVVGTKEYFNQLIPRYGHMFESSAGNTLLCQPLYMLESTYYHYFSGEIFKLTNYTMSCPAAFQLHVTGVRQDSVTDIYDTLMSWGQDSHSDSRTTFRFDGSHLVTVQNMS